jgi:uncharacterized protein with FMN-binding domain
VARRVLTIAACVIALALPPLNAAAAARTRAVKTVTKTVVGTTVVCKKWGSIKVQLKIAQSVVNGKVTKFRILDVSWPIWPQHTVRSVFINERALPLLRQEVLQLQSANLETISGATNVTDSFKQSLQAALLAAKVA